MPSPLRDDHVRIEVPVLRIFGPVLRDGKHEAFTDRVGSTQETKPRISQPQSGCLHVHGAYPYLLARPIVAGPDASMHHGYYRDASGKIDWDDANSVSGILEETHCRLEMALRASHAHHGANSAVSIPGAAVGHADGERPREETPSEETSEPTPLFVRRVTVATGRGFYTYCSGPPAPFLRVEYYDPGLRWRVKMVLERGLELNDLYHPDPRQYDYSREEAAGSDDGVRPLKFRCYEAHVPYTMQVFKDHNLAGMKYVKVGEARFRTPLPKSWRKRTKEE